MPELVPRYHNLPRSMKREYALDVADLIHEAHLLRLRIAAVRDAGGHAMLAAAELSEFRRAVERLYPEAEETLAFIQATTLVKIIEVINNLNRGR